jgi:hypothetical protein
MQVKASFPCYQEPVTGQCPETYESNKQPIITVLPFTPSTLSLSSSFPTKFFFPTLLVFISLLIFRNECKSRIPLLYNVLYPEIISCFLTRLWNTLSLVQEVWRIQTRSSEMHVVKPYYFFFNFHAFCYKNKMTHYLLVLHLWWTNSVPTDVEGFVTKDHTVVPLFRNKWLFVCLFVCLLARSLLRSFVRTWFT